MLVTATGTDDLKLEDLRLGFMGTVAAELMSRGRKSAPDIGVTDVAAKQRPHSLFEAHAIAPSPEVIMNRRAQIGPASLSRLPRCYRDASRRTPAEAARRAGRSPAPEHAVGPPARSS